MLVPHHIGYHPGYSGINWLHFQQRRSPLVEIFSLNGCSESDLASYPLMHTMGASHSGSTMEHTLKCGLKFGLISSRDHHGGFPGSNGDGRVWSLGEELITRRPVGGAYQRRTCAITGDKIKALLRVDGAWPSEVMKGRNKSRQIEVAVEACDFIDHVDHVEVLKNENVLQRIAGPFPSGQNISGGNSIEMKVRIEWGWEPRDTRQPIEAELSVSDGELLGVELCFRGETILSPYDSLLTRRACRIRCWSVTESIAAGALWR